MKKLILTLLVTTPSLAAFAQGKIRMENDLNHLLYYSIGYNYYTPEYAGQLVWNTGPGADIRVELYGGTTANSFSLTLQTSVPMSSTPGRFGPVTFISPNLPGGVSAFMQIRIRSVGLYSYFGDVGRSDIFTFTPSSSIAYNSIVNAGGTA